MKEELINLVHKVEGILDMGKMNSSVRINGLTNSELSEVYCCFIERKNPVGARYGVRFVSEFSSRELKRDSDGREPKGEHYLIISGGEQDG